MTIDSKIIKTGTPGLDELFAINGFKKNSSVLVSGEPGAGKSILAMQFIYNGAKLYGEPGVYITSEQTVDKVRSLAKDLGMDFAPYEESGLVTIIKVPIARSSDIAPDKMRAAIKKAGVSRVALDSITPFEILATDIKDFRLKVMSLVEMLVRDNITLLVTTEKKKTDFENIEFAPEDFIFDGLIFMGRLRRAISFERVLNIVKMRGTDHSIKLHPVEISSTGLVVKPLED